MTKRDQLSPAAIATFLTNHTGWEHKDGALVKTFAFDDYPGGIAFVVQTGFAAEKRNHHPDLTVTYGKVEVRWSTHDAGGVTALDGEMAELSDRLQRT